nr:hypothetical protein [Tanacetum cinerariifolium]
MKRLPVESLVRFSISIEGFVYWFGYGESGSTANFIMYFNLKSEKFGEVCLPDNLVHSKELAISKRNEDLVVLEYCYESEILVCDMWVMKDCGTKSLTKMFTIKSPFDRIVLPFRMNGEAITEMMDHDEKSMHEVYESCSGDFNVFGIQGDYLLFYNVSSYTGSLLLLDEIGRAGNVGYTSIWCDIIKEMDRLASHRIDLISMMHKKIENGLNTSFGRIGGGGATIERGFSTHFC